jgi:hypothetical protein
MTDTETLNGVVTVEQKFPDRVLRRLSRLHAQALGAQEAAQASANVSQAAGARFQEALAEACEEVGVPLPKGQVQAQIDWRTGEFHFEPAPMQGMMPA